MRKSRENKTSMHLNKGKSSRKLAGLGRGVSQLTLGTVTLKDALPGSDLFVY